MKKKTAIIAGAAAAAAVVVGSALWYFLGRDTNNNADNVVYVNTVEMLTGLGSGNGSVNRFAGVVESQQTWEVQQDTEKTVKEILVEVGQNVEVGTPLFTYDTAKMEQDLSQAQLDLEKMDNDITNTKSQIEQLQKEKKQADKDNQLSYTMEIQTLETEMKRSEYEKKSKSVEINKLQDSIQNATVTSEISGVVKSINNGNSTNMYSGESQAFMTVLALGDYRIKGRINEQNMGSIMQGQRMIIRSRVDEEQTWAGTVTNVDMENPTSGNDGGVVYSGTSDSMTQTSNYPFYVELDSSDGLMLGQHVYMEVDNGQQEKKEGLWLPEYFINDVDSDPYVWMDKDGELVKQSVALGEHDENLMEYQIKEGLTEKDAITYPEDGLEEGMKTELGEYGQMGQSNPEPAEMPEDGGEMITDEGIMTDEGAATDGGEVPPMEDGTVTDGSEMPAEDGTAADGSEMAPADSGADSTGTEDAA
ncbi:MAG TPA: efflux RND transporter periplasmic adaptor subunit [Candidatus Egerieimonas faecigallinarum]|nr:efflux RND transporter periplasmic adaptor subunit [Candidatus Egerieimonas faecigallinarum]